MILFDTIGPQVAIIDDRHEEVISIEKTLESLNVGYCSFEASLTEANFPEQPISTVQLIFLDLHFDTNYSGQIIPELCAQWIEKIVPKGKKYYLVIWSKDIDKAEMVIQVLKAIDLMPFSYQTKAKPIYQTGENQYDIKRLLNEVNNEFNEIDAVEDFYGEIYALEDDHVLILILMDEDNTILQKRRFHREILRNMQVKEGDFIHIRIVTRPGAQLIEFSPCTADLTDRFRLKDIFKGFEGSPILKGE